MIKEKKLYIYLWHLPRKGNFQPKELRGVCVKVFKKLKGNRLRVKLLFDHKIKGYKSGDLINIDRKDLISYGEKE